MLDTLFSFLTTSDFTGDAFYWATPLGFVSILAILLCSLYRIFYTDADLLNSICNWVYVLICSTAFLHIHENTNPKHQMVVLVTTLAISKLWGVRNLKPKKGVYNG